MRYVPFNFLSGSANILQVLREKLNNECSISELDLSLQTSNAENTISLIHGYAQLHSANLIEPILGRAELDKLTNYLSSNLFTKHSQYTPLQLVVAREILNMVFALGFSDSELLKLLLVCLLYIPFWFLYLQVKQDETVVEKGKSNLKKRGKSTADEDGEENGDKDKDKSKEEEEEQNDYTVKKTTKGSEFYDDFMNQVCGYIL